MYKHVSNPLPKHLFVVIDYNLARFHDVQIMTRHAKVKRGLTTVLLRKSPSDRDRSLADYVIDLDPRGPHFADQAEASLRSLGTPVAILPFSDDAVVSGAAVAERFGVRSDSADLANAAYSKIIYRDAEASALAIFPQERFQSPLWCEVNSVEEVATFAKQATKGFVIKPSCEGNNRGVVKVLPGDDLASAFSEVASYLSNGALCEELIDLPEEYSYDGIGTLSFITKKYSSSGRYPVEYGQKVPARLPAHLEVAVGNAGRFANVIVGQRIGPFHNEIKLDPVTALTGVIEPNRRPAGMRIWHLAKKVYGLDFFELWVDTMLGKAPVIEHLIPRGSAAIRMLMAPHKGRLAEHIDGEAVLHSILLQPALQQLSQEHMLEWSNFMITAEPNTMVSDVIDDNSKFIAQISVYTPRDTTDLDQILSIFEREWRLAARDLVVMGPIQVCGGL